jgi:hypothetical protein
VMAPASANSLDTSPMRRMFSTRSSVLRRGGGGGFWGGGGGG